MSEDLRKARGVLVKCPIEGCDEYFRVIEPTDPETITGVKLFNHLLSHAKGQVVSAIVHRELVNVAKKYVVPYNPEEIT